MDDRGGRLRFARESLPRRSAVAEMRRQHLDRNVAIQRGIERLQHDAHPTPSDHSHDFICPQTAEHPIVVRRRQQLQHRVVAGRRVVARRRIDRGGIRPRRIRRRLLAQQRIAHAGPDVVAGCGRFQPAAAIVAVIQVRLECRLLLRRSISVAGTVQSAPDRTSFGYCSLCYLPTTVAFRSAKAAFLSRSERRRAPTFPARTRSPFPGFGE